MIQRGAGTSTNMNTNEVIANRGLEILWHAKGKYKFLHPNDNVNTLSQSTNDTYPTAAKLAIVMGPERGPEEHGSTQERARSEGRRVQGLGIVFYGGWHQRCRDCQLFHCRLCVNNLGHCRSCRFPTLEEWVNLVLGAWLLVSPWVLGFSTATALMWNAVLIGALIVVSASWALGKEQGGK